MGDELKNISLVSPCLREKVCCVPIGVLTQSRAGCVRCLHSLHCDSDSNITDLYSDCNQNGEGLTSDAVAAGDRVGL
jgi:hypothetical protein